ncbi:hypothetical protein ElyMa_001833400 [Elysia marginata]|uniref:Uncharacterized protein n=1 Tax=Elysia marginata TaxID=1093978 RepID=A0AAV4EKQ5_9GAST|nr:hypothetical protein ElyMa_001833400 [Elysia marginata]
MGTGRECPDKTNEMDTSHEWDEVPTITYVGKKSIHLMVTSLLIGTSYHREAPEGRSRQVSLPDRVAGMTVGNRNPSSTLRRHSS